MIVAETVAPIPPPMQGAAAMKILLVIGGGIAAYKAAELVRLIRRDGGEVTCVLTEAGSRFVTPLTLAALSENVVHTTLWDLKNEVEMGHIRLSREADLVVVCPATADLLARMAAGMADDLATTLLLATDKPVLAVPAMNVRMWHHAATVANIATLRTRGVTVMDPDVGAMACGEVGPGRLPEPEAIFAAVREMLVPPARPLAGRHVLITAGPTHEPIDPVRYIANRSSGKQGFALAAAAAAAGAEVTLVAGPVDLPTPAGVRRIDVQTARDMAHAVDAALPCDVAIMVAAVADWRTAESSEHKRKKDGTGRMAPLDLVENPDILAGLGHCVARPRLLIGFAAETEQVIPHAQAKLARKGADWIIANDVSGDVMGGGDNTVHIISAAGVESLPRMTKEHVAQAIIAKVADAL
jgi:phosphopantothenoylcysteine decarboxylase/phosphopantothenate--cysteine ligase